MQTCWQLLGTAAMLAGASHHSECSITRNEAHQPVTLQGTSNPHTAAFLLVGPSSRPAPNIWHTCRNSINWESNQLGKAGSQQVELHILCCTPAVPQAASKIYYVPHLIT